MAASQAGVPVEVVKLSVPLPVLETAAVLLAGSLPPVVAVKLRLVGVTERGGGRRRVGDGEVDGDGRR